VNLPDIHCKEDFISTLKNQEFCEDMIHGMFFDDYSTSKHALVLYSMAIGLKAKTIVEVGFGRSTLALLLAVEHLRQSEVDSNLICCDRYDYSSYLHVMDTEIDKSMITFVVGDAKSLIRPLHGKLSNGIDFMFLDYFSSRERSAESTYKAIHRFLPYMRQNGIIAVHDTIEKKYFVKDAFKCLREDKNLEVMSLPYNYGLGLIRKLDKSEYGKIEDNWKKKGDK